MYEIRTSVGQRLRSIAGGMVPVVLFLLLAGGGAYIGAKDSFERAFSLVGIGMISLFVAGFEVATRAGGRVELAVTHTGVQLGEATVPWPSVQRIVVAGTDVGIRLVPGAPLPDGVPGVVHDPRRPQEVQLWHGFGAGRLDVERLVEAAWAFAPTGVAVVTRSATEPEWYRTRPRAGRERRDAWAVVTGVRLKGGRVYRRSTFAEHRRAKPHPVVSFALPDGRQVIAETGNPGRGEPGDRVPVSYDVDNPTDVTVHSGAPQSRWVRTW